MSVADVIPREAGPARSSPPAGRNLAAIAGAGVMALLAVVAGLLLTCGLGVVLWAITPSSAASPVALVRAGVTTFSAANGMTVQIGRAALTLPPLMITAVAVTLLTSVAGCRRDIGGDRSLETVAVLTAAAVYAAAVTVAGVTLGSPHAIRADQWWRPALLALLVVAGATLVRGDSWRRYLLDRLPPWVPVSIRLGAVGFTALLGGGAITLLIGLVRSVGDAITVGTLAAPGPAGGFGMALLSIAYLPNAVIAGVGYSTGAGFTIGAGSYSPFGSSPVELPAVSLLTAAPDGQTVSRLTLLVLIIPVLVAVLIGRCAARRLDLRSDRLLAVGGAALMSALGMALLAAFASGGVTGGEWSSSGVPPLLVGAAVAVGLGGVGAAVAGVARVPASAIEKRDRVAKTVSDADSRHAGAIGTQVADAELGDADTGGADGDAEVADAGVRHAEVADAGVADVAGVDEAECEPAGVGDSGVADDGLVAEDVDSAGAGDTAEPDAPTPARSASEVPAGVGDCSAPERRSSLPEADLLSRTIPDTDAEVAAELARRPPSQVG